MRFHYDLMGAGTIVRKMKAEAGTYYVGAGVVCGDTDGTDIGLVQPATGKYKNFVGMCNQALVASGTLAAATTEDLEVIINPFAVYLVEYDITGTGITPLGFTTLTGTNTCGSGLGHDNLGGGYLYRIVDPGAGELNMIDESSVSTTTQTWVLEDTPTVDPTTVSRIHFIYPVGPYLIDLGDSGRKIDSNDPDTGGGASGTDGLPVTILQNYIQYDGVEMERLVPDKHAEMVNLDNLHVHFYADVCFYPGSWLVE